MTIALNAALKRLRQFDLTNDKNEIELAGHLENIYILWSINKCMAVVRAYWAKTSEEFNEAKKDFDKL